MFPLKPTTDELLCPRCDAPCALVSLVPQVPSLRLWICSSDKQHRFMPGFERLLEERRLARRTE